MPKCSCLAAFSSLVVLSACSTPRHAPEERFYLVASNIKLPYWETAAAGLNRAAAELRVHAEIAGPDSYDAAKQRDEFRRIVALKPSGILVSAADPVMLKPEINAAVAAGIPVVTMDADSPGSNRLFFIGTNNYQAGLMGGRYLAAKLGRGASVVVLTIPAQANLIERLSGYEEALGAAGIKIVQTIDVQGAAAVAFDKTMEIIEKSKIKVDAFVSLEASSGKEIADVLARKNVTGKIVIAMDTDQGTIEWIEKGGIAATIAQKPYTMAYYGLRMLDDLHHNKPNPLASDWAHNLRAPVPSIVDTGAALIDKANVASVREAMK